MAVGYSLLTFGKGSVSSSLSFGRFVVLKIQVILLCKTDGYCTISNLFKYYTYISYFLNDSLVRVLKYKY